MKRVLFFPSYFGNGFGHVARCLAVAKEMSCRGWAVGMVLAGKHAKPVQEAGYKVFKPFFPKSPPTGNTVHADYTYIVDESMQVLRDGFVRPWRVFAALAEAMHAIKAFRPDILVGDMSLLTWLAGQKTGIPVVQILQAIVHPASRGVIWWEDVPAGIISPDISSVFAPVLRKLNLRNISRAEELLQGDCYLIPGIPEIDPLPVDVPNTHYIGALLYHPTDTRKLPSSLHNMRKEQVIYVTHGGGRGKYCDRNFFNLVTQALGNMPWTVIYSTGRSIDMHALTPVPQNISCYPWLPNGEVMRQSDVVVFHGGYTTMMETICYGVPSVIIPTQSEQEGNGLRLKERSAARVLQAASLKSTQLLRHRWRYGEFTTLVQKESRISAEMLSAAVESVLRDVTFANAAKKLSSIASNYAGATAGVDLIESLLR